MAAGTSVRLVIPSEVRLIDLVHQASEQMARIAGMKDDEALNIGLAVREAVINAIQHGNGEDPTRKVTVTLSVGREGLTAKVRDQGQGFDPTTTPDPRNEPNLLRESGRGLLLIQAFVDKVDFRRHARGGMEVVMVKRGTNGSSG